MGQILVLTYPIIGNYGVPNTTELDVHGLLKNIESFKHSGISIAFTNGEKGNDKGVEKGRGEGENRFCVGPLLAQVS